MDLNFPPKQAASPDASNGNTGLIPRFTWAIVFLTPFLLSMFEGIKDALGKAVGEWTVANLTPVAAFAFFAYLCWFGHSLKHNTKTVKFGDREESYLRFSPFWRNAGTPILAVGILGMIATPVMFWATIEAWFIGPPPQIKLVASKSELPLGEQAAVSITLNGKEPPMDHLCEWKADGMDRQLISCEKPFVYSPARLQVSVGGEKPVKIEAKLFKKDAEVPNRLILVGVAEPIVILVKHRVFSIKVNPAEPRLYHGGHVALEALINGQIDDANFTYSWHVPEGKLLAVAKGTLQSPTVSYVADVALEVGKTKKNIELVLRVTDREGKQVNDPLTVKILVKQVPPVYHLYVLDGCARMSKKTKEGPDYLSLAKTFLSQELKIIGSRQGYVGIQLFGSPPGVKAPCDNTRALLPLAPLELAPALKQLDLITPGQEEAPLLLALQKGLETLKDVEAQPDARFHVITVTAGPDTCLKIGPEQFLKKVRASFEERAGLNRWWSEFKLLNLTVGIAFTEPETRMWKAFLDNNEYREFRHVVLLARSPEHLREILAAFTQIGSPSLADRTRGYNELIRLHEPQQDERGINRLKTYRDVPPGP